MRIGKILGVWAAIAGLMICNGALRVTILQPWLGLEAGEMMSGFIGLIIVVGVSRMFLVSEPDLPLRRVIFVSAMWVALTVLFETTVGRLSGQTWAEIGRGYAVWDGAFWPVILVATGSAPFMWLRRWTIPIPTVVK
jgi:hypothetical protein